MNLHTDLPAFIRPRMFNREDGACLMVNGQRIRLGPLDWEGPPPYDAEVANTLRGVVNKRGLYAPT